MTTNLTISLWVAAGSALGGFLRYWCFGLIARLVGETFPWGTVFVNILGSFLIGLLIALTAPDGRLPVGIALRQFLGFGILGGFTTFSSFSLNTLTLIQNGAWISAGANVAASVVLCLLGVWLGHGLGLALNR